MKPNPAKTKHAIAMLFAGVVLSAPAFADKPSWAGGGGKGKGHGQVRSDAAREFRFERDNVVIAPEVRRHRNDQFARLDCPPGLAKKNNGCMPPGQAKKAWAVGQALPPGVTWRSVPPHILSQLGTPPLGHRYVRVGNDVLLVSSGNAVIDLIRSL